MSSGSKVNYLIGKKAELPATGINGTFYLCSDTGELFHAVDNSGTLVLINSVTPYATCTTAVGTKAKAVSVKGFKLFTGSRICVKFNNGNSASSPTLNVNSTGAKPIYYNGAAVSRYSIPAGKICELVYDGTNYVIIGELRTSLVQEVSSITTFTLAHDLNGYPRVTVLDGDNSVCECRVVYPDKNNVTLSFNQNFTGKILLDL